MKSTGWGLIGPGRIARRFADALVHCPGARLVAVAGRDAARAEAFAVAHATAGARPRVHAGIQALLDDPAVDAVYVATPHPAHEAAVSAALQAGKPVLCEKPLAATAAQAERLLDLAERRRVLLMEAVWTRLLPSWGQVRAWLQDDAIGPLQAMQSSFCFRLPHDPAGRHFDPQQGGGALLDIGIYNLTMSQWVMALHGREDAPGHDVSGRLGPTGVDVRVAGQLHWSGGIASQFVCAFDGTADNSFRIHGEAGWIEVPDGFWHATRAVLHRPDQPPEVADRPFRGNGFEYEIDEFTACLQAGRLQSAAVPHAHTLATLRQIDAMRARLGVRYPFE